VGIFERLRSLFGKTTRNEPTIAEIGFADESPLQEERRVRQRLNARTGTRILIIDDSPTVVAVLRKMLRSVGYATLEALDAENGLEVARAERPDLIFLDIILPGMNGFAALRVLRRNPLTVRIPVILMSGNEQATEQFFGSRIGVDDFMKKPFSRAEVFARIERLLDAELVPRRVKAAADSEPIEAPTRV
jgi:twitching motility two-component system response regulator PilH